MVCGWAISSPGTIAAPCIAAGLTTMRATGEIYVGSPSSRPSSTAAGTRMQRPSRIADGIMIANVLARNRWWIVVASLLGLMVGPSIHVFVFGVFVKPITEDLGLGRGLLSSAFLVSL